MPIYTYELCEGDCKVCSGTFELNRPISRPDLKECPLCRKPVKKIMGSFSTPKHMKPIGPAEARSAGFKMYKKRDTGVYEQL
jgi:putative FmdB family regulatory protein